MDIDGAKELRKEGKKEQCSQKQGLWNRVKEKAKKEKLEKEVRKEEKEEKLEKEERKEEKDNLGK